MNMPPQPGFAGASYTAVSTLAFVSPGTVLPQIVESVVNALSESDFAIWATPEGSTYIDGKFVPAVINRGLTSEMLQF